MHEKKCSFYVSLYGIPIFWEYIKWFDIFQRSANAFIVPDKDNEF